MFSVVGVGDREENVKPCDVLHRRTRVVSAVDRARGSEADLEVHANKIGRVAQDCGKSLRITRPLAAPNVAASLVDNMDTGLLV